MRVVVVGAGIMGLSTAWALDRLGAEVVVVDQDSIPAQRGSSIDYHRAIRYPYGDARGYQRAVTEAYAAWGRMWADLGRVHAAETGTLVLSRSTRDSVWSRRSLQTLLSEGIEVEPLDVGDIEKMYPPLLADELAGAYRLPTGGVLFAADIVADLARYLRDRGVSLRPETRVTDVSSGKVTTESGPFEGDAVVVCAGPWIRRVLGGVSATPSRQLVVYLEPPARLAESWREMPLLLDVDSDAPGYSGAYVLPDVFGSHGGGRIKVGDHRFSLAGDPDAPWEATADEGRELLTALRGRFRHLNEYRIAETRVCFYTVDPDETFRLLALDDGLWAITGFSGHGFKFGAWVGETLARARLGTLDVSAAVQLLAGELPQGATQRIG